MKTSSTPKSGYPPDVAQLRTLQDGSYFEIYTLEKEYRNLELISITDCAASIRGEKFVPEGEDGKFVSLGSNYCIACSTMVRPKGRNKNFVPPVRIPLP